MKMNRILVVSDFHLTSGKDPVTGRWSPTEDFFWDGEFRDFLAHYSTRPRTTLVINGDLFDFLQVLVFPTDEEQKLFQIREAEINRTYGLQCSEVSAEFQIDKIMDGHPVLFQALADFLIAGNDVKILKGNHDVQLCWPKVQERLFMRLQRMCAHRRKSIKRSQVEFLPWVYYIPGMLYIEHGNQYEETCAFRNFLVPRLPLNYPGTSTQIELDLSSFLVRYLTNRVEPVNPLADNIRPLSKYYDVMWKTSPFFMITTFGTALRFVLKAFAKARQLKSGSARQGFERIVKENVAMIGEQARRFAKGSKETAAWLEKQFRDIYGNMAEPTLEQGAWKFLWTVGKGVLKRSVWLIPLYAITLIPALTTSLIDGVEEGKSPFFSGLVQTVLIVVLGVVPIYLRQLWRRWQLKQKRKEEADASLIPDVSKEMRRRAEHIASSLGVRYVTFGHTHYADTSPLPNGGRYFNTGTWMGIYEEQEQLYREAHQFTFLKIEGGSAELLRWNPDSKESQPVAMIDTANPLTVDEDNIVKLVVQAFRK